MRKSLCFELIIVFLLALTGAQSLGKSRLTSISLLSARGFKTNQCYLHAALRVCEKQSKGLRCWLRIFPETSAELTIGLSSKDTLITGRATTDFGMFRFKLAQIGNGVETASVINVERMELKEWLSRKSEEPTGYQVLCD